MRESVLYVYVLLILAAAQEGTEHPSANLIVQPLRMPLHSPYREFFMADRLDCAVRRPLHRFQSLAQTVDALVVRTVDDARFSAGFVEKRRFRANRLFLIK